MSSVCNHRLMALSDIACMSVCASSFDAQIEQLSSTMDGWPTASQLKACC